MLHNGHSLLALCGAAAQLAVHPGDEVYQINGPGAEHEIEMALLSDLVTPIKLAFVGGKDARRFAELYHGTWIEDGPAAKE